MNIKIKITGTTNVEFPIIIRDKKGNIIYLQYKDDIWEEYTYDEKGNILTYKDSSGNWYEYTYNNKGKQLTSKTSGGYYVIKGEFVTKEEYEAFVNPIPEYTMEELVAKLGHNFKIKK